MNEEMLETLLCGLLNGHPLVDMLDSVGFDDHDVDSVDNFDSVGLSSDNRGIVVRFTDRTEFEIQIVQSV